jgi:hypothetical protein
MPFTVEVTTRIRRSPFWTTEVHLPAAVQSEPQIAVMRSFPAPVVEESWRSLLGRIELPSHYAARQDRKE